MYKNLLFISDNPSILTTVEEKILEVYKVQYPFSFKYACSKFSNIKNFNHLRADISIIDLKDTNTIKSILNTYDLVFSIHCKQLFPSQLVENVKCINVHPGYNPINRGWYPQVFAIINDLEIGATIHEIDQKLDHGNIIARRKVRKYAYDTSLSIYNRVVDQEISLLKENFEEIIDNTYSVTKPEKEGELYLKKDFNALCKLNLEEKVTMGEAINRLRALTHGDFNNAYFIDPITNNKIYIKIELQHEEG